MCRQRWRHFETFAKGFFLPPALLANAHLLLKYTAFAAELKNKHAVFCTRSQVMQNSNFVKL